MTYLRVTIKNKSDDSWKMLSSELPTHSKHLISVDYYCYYYQ